MEKAIQEEQRKNSSNTTILIEKDNQHGNTKIIELNHKEKKDQ